MVAGRTAIVVAGMHRSGTSLTTRVINLLGAELGSKLVSAGIDERGQWKSRAFQELHNRLLVELDSDIYSPVSFPHDWFGGAAARHWIDRMGHLLPLWLQAMRESSIAPRFVLLFRQADAVARSLEARESGPGSADALPYAQGIAVWLRYVLAAEKYTRGQVRSFVAFDKVRADWRTEFARIGRQLGVEWPDRQRAHDAIDAFVQRGARRHDIPDAGNAVPAREIDVMYRRVYQDLRQAASEPQALLPAFDAAAQAIAAAEGIFGPLVVASARAFAGLRNDNDAVLRRRKADRADTQRRFEAEIASRDVRIVEATAHAKSLQHERDRAAEYALSLGRGRDEALRYARSLEQARDAAVRSARHARNATPVFFTIASRNYLAYAITLMQSIAEHHPHAPRYLILADRDDGDAALIGAPFVTIKAEALALPDFDAFAFRYGITEFNTAIKPYAFSHLRRLHPDSGIVYLDPDVLVVAPLAQVENAFAGGALAVLTPHLLEPVDDDRHPGEREILASGAYNCGFVAIAAHAAADRLLAWWADRLEFGALNDTAAGLFTDQKWIDLAPGMFPDVHILRDEGYNLAYWNLSQRPVSRRGGRWYAAERPLAFVHFSGVDPDRPAQFSRHQNRHTQATIGELSSLYAEYLGRLAANGHAEHRAKPYAYGTFADGEPICDAVRALFRRYFDKGTAEAQRYPFSMDRGLYDLPCSELPVRSDAPVTRLMYAVWTMRGDLRRAFDIGEARGREGFLRWFARNAAAEMAIPERHLDAVRRALAVRGDSGAGDMAPGKSPGMPGPLRRAGSFCLDLLDWSCRFRPALRLYAFIPQGTRNRIRSRLQRVAGKPALSSRARHSGINLVGYAHGEFGVAEILRRYAYTLQGSGVPFVVRNFDVGVPSRQCDPSLQRFIAEECRYGVNLFCINADQLPIAREHLGDAVFAGRYNIGCWFWELERFPEQWLGAAELVDEIWVASPFVRDAIAACTPKPVHIVPVALGVNLPRKYSRGEFGLAEGDFLCLFSFDFNSHVTRKNAQGAIAAFRRAFGDDRRDVRLVIKTINGVRHEDALRRLTDAAEGDDRIEVRDGFLDRFGMWALQACCDCYISLHRSEGLGLGMAECMLLGKPVVATAYSGNLAFMDADNSCLVDYLLVPVEEGAYPAWQGQRWAEPNIDQAAAYLKRLADDPAYARQIGEKAQTSVRRAMSPAGSLAAIAARLAEIYSRQPC